MTAPPSQKFRQISFTLSGTPGGDGDAQFSFIIRPEELTHTEPSRMSVQQTLGGAWLDSFGAGVSTITLSGHNGWRGGALVSGEDLFFSLRAACFVGWHEARADAIAAGNDPDTVKLYFTDNLDDITAVVAPVSFTLHRSKSSPLLIRYQIELKVLADASESKSIFDQIIDGLSNPLRWLASVTGLGTIINQIQTYLTIGQAVFGAAVGAVRQFVNIGVQLIGSISDIAAEVRGVFSDSTAGILTIGISYSRAASTAFQVLADDDTLSDNDRLPLMAMASAFNGAACSMANGFDLIPSYDDFSSLRGESTCSSTAGGDPPSIFTVAGANPFAYLFPASGAPVIVTADASQALAALQGDPLAMQGQQAIVTDLMRRAAVGVTVS